MGDSDAAVSERLIFSSDIPNFSFFLSNLRNDTSQVNMSTKPFSGLVERHSFQLLYRLDFVFAKCSFSKQIDNNSKMQHPLLDFSR